MKLEDIEQIVNGMCVFMPSGIQANLYVDDSGKIKVVYYNMKQDEYTEEDFTELMRDGIMVFNEPSQKIMETKENRLSDAMRLERIAKVCKDTKLKQQALSLLDALNLGEDVKDDIEKLFKKLDKSEEIKESKMDRISRITKLTEDLEAMLTDVNDLDMPDALADTIETTEEGEVLTLGNAVEEIKDTIEDAIEDVKDEIEELKDEVENVQDNVEEVTDEVADEIADEVADEVADEIIDEVPEEGFEPAEEVEEIEEEPVMEESFKSFLRTGSIEEDLNKTKQEIDKMAKQGADPEKMKDAISVMSADDKEKEEAEKYAAEKLTESLIDKCMATRFTSQLNTL